MSKVRQTKHRHADAEAVSRNQRCVRLLIVSTVAIVFLPGTHGECASRVHRVDIADGKCSDLEPIVVRLTALFTQSHIGLQRAVPRFERNEYRHWCIAVPGDDGCMRWLQSFSLKSGHNLENSSLLDVRLSAPFSMESVACHDLVQHLLSTPSGPVHHFFQSLLQQGLPALRIDCGYDYSKKRAFVNEFAIPTDGSFWPCVHNLELPVHIANKIGSMLFQALDQSQQHETDADEGASAAATSCASASASTEAAAEPWEELMANASSASTTSAAAGFAASSGGSEAGSTSGLMDLV